MSILLEILRSLIGTLVRQWPELVSTFYGVLLGGMATLAVVRWQIGEERRTRGRHDQEFLSVLVEHVNREITKNTHIVEDLIEACAQSRVARIEAWDWAATIVGSLSTEAHNGLYRTGLQRYLPDTIKEEIRRANTTVIDLRNRVFQARAEYIFNDRYREDGEGINNRVFDDVKAALPGARERLVESDRIVEPGNLPWVESGDEAPKQKRGQAIRRILRWPGRRAKR